MIVSALELKKLTQDLTGTTIQETLHNSQSNDRKNLHILSKQRVQNWDNTIAGHHRKKLEARHTRILKDENAKQELDEIYNKDMETLRQDSIMRAKRLQYFHKDTIRAFHSKILLFQTIKERDLQISEKNIRKDVFSMNDLKYHELERKALEKRSMEDAMKQARTHLDRIECAKNQKQQIQEKVAAQKAAALLEQKEQEEFRKKDAEYKREIMEIEAQRKLNMKKLAADLKKIQDENSVRKHEQKAADLERQEIASAWSARKNRQCALKKEIELKWFNEALAQREKLAEEQAKTYISDAQQRQKIYLLGVEKQEKAAELIEEERKQKIIRQRQTLRSDYAAHVKQAAAEKEAILKAEKELLQVYLKESEEDSAARKAYKKKCLQVGKEFQQHHLNEMARKKTEKKNAKVAQLEYDFSKLEEAKAEDMELYNYMTSLSNEDWAKDNVYLKQYLHNTFNKKKKIRPSIGPPNTKERLGLAPGKYRKKDLVTKLTLD